MSARSRTILLTIGLLAACHWGEDGATPSRRRQLDRTTTATVPATGARLTVDSTAGQVIVELAAERLGAAGTDTAMRIAVPQAVALPIDGWLRSVRVDVVDGAGRVLPKRLLHHANVIAPEQRELFSPIMMRIGAAGPETAPIELPRLLGLRVHRGDSVLVAAMLDNPLPQPQPDVRVRVSLGYTGAYSWVPPLSIHPFYVDVMPPAGSHAYDLPAGRSEKSWEGSPAIGGRMLAVGGHLHQYGVALRFRDVTAGRDLWVAQPVRDAAGEVLAVPTTKFLWRGGVTLRPDHVYRLTAVYDNPTGHVIPDGAMGTLGGVFLPARGAAWPRVARNDPAYRLDVQVTYDTTMTMRMASNSMPHEMDARLPSGDRRQALDAASGGSSRLAARSHLPTAP
jgi:hypothetical protein